MGQDGEDRQGLDAGVSDAARTRLHAREVRQALREERRLLIGEVVVVALVAAFAVVRALWLV